MGQTTQAGGARQDMRQWVSASWTDLPRGGCSAIDHTTGSCDRREWVGATDHFISPVYQEGPGLGGRPWVQPGNYPLCAELKEAQGGTRLAEVLGSSVHTRQALCRSRHTLVAGFGISGVQQSRPPLTQDWFHKGGAGGGAERRATANLLKDRAW